MRDRSGVEVRRIAADVQGDRTWAGEQIQKGEVPAARRALNGRIGKTGECRLGGRRNRHPETLGVSEEGRGDPQALRVCAITEMARVDHLVASPDGVHEQRA